MHQKDFYKNLSEKEIEESMRSEGFYPVLLSHRAGYRYNPHKHPEAKLLAFLDGSMWVRAGKEELECSAGDKLLIPGNTEHEAIVGKDGCVFFWAEK